MFNFNWGYNLLPNLRYFKYRYPMVSSNMARTREIPELNGTFHGKSSNSVGDYRLAMFDHPEICTQRILYSCPWGSKLDWPRENTDGLDILSLSAHLVNERWLCLFSLAENVPVFGMLCEH